MPIRTQLDIIKSLRQEGKTYQSIANVYGVSRQRIHQLLASYKSPQKKYRKHFVKSLKETILTYYGGGKLACVCCGFNDLRALSLDHINGRNRDSQQPLDIRTGHHLYITLKKNGFPSGYQTLCMNCQWIKKAENKEVRMGKRDSLGKWVRPAILKMPNV